ncbi:MAG: hypothetical protein KDA87_11590 [Planctomycetales bacterium]|nr:hypothetical protein [Planctomycetales bacterium]
MRPCGFAPSRYFFFENDLLQRLGCTSLVASQNPGTLVQETQRRQTHRREELSAGTDVNLDCVLAALFGSMGGTNRESLPAITSLRVFEKPGHVWSALPLGDEQVTIDFGQISIILGELVKEVSTEFLVVNGMIRSISNNNISNWTVVCWQANRRVDLF